MIGLYKPTHFYIYLLKQIFNEGTDVIEVHALGPECITKAIKVIDVLTKYTYAVISKFKTKRALCKDGK